MLAFQAWHHIANVEGPTPKKSGVIETKSLGFRLAVGVFSFQNLKATKPESGRNMRSFRLWKTNPGCGFHV